MSSGLRFTAILILLTVAGSLPAFADAVDDLITAEMSARRIPGAALKIIKNGREIKTACYGVANLEHGIPVTTNSVFEIGSITKTLTAACILLLQQNGKLSLDDAVTRHIPAAPASWTNITVRHLLTHTSGLKSYTGLDGFELNRRLTQAQFVAAIAAQKREFDPGESFKYSNTGFSLLGYVIENASGQTYWQFLKSRILDPLGMNETTDRNPATILPHRVSGYEQTNRVHINRDYDLTDVFSAGAIASTAGDLAKWNAAMDSERLLSATSKTAMWRPALLNSGKPTSYGLGWFIENASGRKNIGHGGSTSGFSASLQRFPDENLAVILLTNTDEMIATSLARKIAALHMKPTAGE